MFNTFVGDIGTDNPLFIIQEKADNVYEFYKNSEKLWALLGDESKVLWEKQWLSSAKLNVRTAPIDLIFRI